MFLGSFVIIVPSSSPLEGGSSAQVLPRHENLQAVKSQPFLGYLCTSGFHRVVPKWCCTGWPAVPISSAHSTRIEVKEFNLGFIRPENLVFLFLPGLRRDGEASVWFVHEEKWTVDGYAFFLHSQPRISGGEPASLLSMNWPSIKMSPTHSIWNIKVNNNILILLCHLIM